MYLTKMDALWTAANEVQNKMKI